MADYESLRAKRKQNRLICKLEGHGWKETKVKKTNRVDALYYAHTETIPRVTVINRCGRCGYHQYK